ncbi:hypothetical protein [Aureimonas jatrophae]|uniref:Uncharacterized protein n=1 Tax=Aureimonas jatrophae TaxID=1166073 RepID=A0A1H0LLQ1_9HYPH|nr:hypothetical protein [Aureimonas jatrophae]MBB3952581.1 hypothetical protein [Aureimonas jatrophae]SDO69169.1 hypothetical protein SAMN05192530_11096 [Aureimonas jatrophae]
MRGLEALTQNLSTKAYTTLATRILGLLLLAVLLMAGLLALVLASIAIAIAWTDHRDLGNVTWQAMVTVHSAWIAIAAALVALLSFRHRKSSSVGRTLFQLSSRTLLAFLPIAAIAAFWQANLPSRPLNTEADVRPRLEPLLKQRVRGFPQFARIESLPEQIRNVRIKGPSMTFEPDTTRYVTFDFDTGCGRVIKVLAVLSAGDADTLGSVDDYNCQP